MVTDDAASIAPVLAGKSRRGRRAQGASLIMREHGPGDIPHEARFSPGTGASVYKASARGSQAHVLKKQKKADRLNNDRKCIQKKKADCMQNNRKRFEKRNFLVKDIAVFICYFPGAVDN